MLMRIIKIQDRKSTRLNSSHLGISYAVFCLKKKNGLPIQCWLLYHAGWGPHGWDAGQREPASRQGMAARSRRRESERRGPRKEIPVFKQRACRPISRLTPALARTV